MKKSFSRRVFSIILTACFIASIVLSMPLTVSAKQGHATDIGWPEFNYLDPSVLDPGVPLDPTTSIRQAIFEKDAATGDGTSFYIDRVLHRPGVATDNSNSVLTRGRSIFSVQDSVPTGLGWSNNVVWLDTANSFNPLNVVNLRIGENVIQVQEQRNSRSNNPSYWSSNYSVSDSRFSNASITAKKFISYNNAAVAIIEISNNGSTDIENVNFTITSSSCTDPGVLDNGQPELTGIRSVRANLTTLYPRITADLDGKPCILKDNTLITPTVTIPAGGKIQLKVVTGITTKELPESTDDYLYYATASADEAFKTQVQTYNKWYADTIPYIDIPNKAVQKAIEYRWWLTQFNTFDASIPGYDFQYPDTMEGVLGYNNAIVLTQCMRLQDTKWMRSAYLPYGTLLNVGNASMSSAFLDNPGKIANWNNHYGQYIAQSGLEAYKVIGGDPAIAEAFAYYFEHDAKGQLLHYGQDFKVPGRPEDPENNYGNAFLIAYANNYMTGNDADTISMSYPNSGTRKVVPESAYVFAAADSAAKLYEYIGNTEKANEMRNLAERIRQDALEFMWCEKDKTFETIAISPRSGFVVHNEEQPNLIPWKVNNLYNFFSTGLVPQDPASVAKYGEAFEYFKYADEYPIFPCYTANQVDKKQYSGGTNNFSNINFTLQARAYESAIRTYDPENKYVTPEMLSMLIAWQAYEVYPNGDTRYPNNNEYFANWNAETKTMYRSWIHHDTLGNFNYLFFEAMAGIRPRFDKIIELDPIDFNPVNMNLPNAEDFKYDHFMVNNFKYHGMDMTIVWDDPKDGIRHYEAPEGYSLYVDGERIFTIDRLAHVEYNTETGEILVDGKPAEVEEEYDYEVNTTYSTNELVPKDTVTATSSVKNNTNSQKNVMAITALYDENERMRNLSFISKAIEPGATERLSAGFMLPEDVAGYKVKTFVWGGTSLDDTDMIPLSNVRILGEDDSKGEDRARLLYLKPGNIENFPESSEIDIKNDINPKTAEYFKKSGIDLEYDLTNRNNLTQIPGTVATASYTAKARQASWFEKHRADGTNPNSKAVNEEPPSPDAAIDGVTVSQPFWGNDSSPNETDWLQITFPSEQTFNNVKLFFYNDRDGFGNGPTGRGYAEPLKYTIEYLDGENWVPVTNNNKTPIIPAANFNDALFDRVTSKALRIVVQNNGNHPVAITEVQVFNSPLDAPEVINMAPEITARIGKKGNLNAELIGTYIDDGLPEDKEPTFKWTVISAPEGAFYQITNNDKMIASITADTAGDYTIKYEASDGEYTVEKVITVNLSKTASEDLAIAAETNASYTAGWENVKGPNNPAFEPTTSNPGTGKGWGNWSAGAPAWFQYTWNSPVYINSCAIYWYDDNGGTRVPSNWSIQYSEDGINWTDVTIDPSTPYSSSVAKNTYNTLNFEPITTRYLRVYIRSITSNAAGTGILRWKVYGPIADKVTDLHIMTKVGTIPQLPDTIPVVFDTGVTMNLPVTWSSIEQDQVAEDNTFVVTGDVLGNLAKAIIYVRSDADAATITDVWPMSISTAKGVEPLYPQFADVSYNNGGRTNTVVPVTWNEEDKAAVDINTPGDYTVRGTIEKADGTAQVTLTVTVK